MLLAKQASIEDSKDTFLRSWSRLADELEESEAFLKTVSEIEVKSPTDLPLKAQRTSRRSRRPR
jgi:hypothetical protein